MTTGLTASYDMQTGVRAWVNRFAMMFHPTWIAHIQPLHPTSTAASNVHIHTHLDQLNRAVDTDDVAAWLAADEIAGVQAHAARVTGRAGARARHCRVQAQHVVPLLGQRYCRAQ